MKIETFLFCFIFVNKNESNQTGYVPITRAYLVLKSNIHVTPYCKETPSCRESPSRYWFLSEYDIFYWRNSYEVCR